MPAAISVSLSLHARVHHNVNHVKCMRFDAGGESLNAKLVCTVVGQGNS